MILHREHEGKKYQLHFKPGADLTGAGSETFIQLSYRADRVFNVTDGLMVKDRNAVVPRTAKGRVP